MSDERVDLDDLRALAVAALASARVVASSGADVFDRALLVDATFAVAAQPAVVVALLDRVESLERALGDLIAECEERTENPEGDYYADQREILEQGVVLP